MTGPLIAGLLIAVGLAGIAALDDRDDNYGKPSKPGVGALIFVTMIYIGAQLLALWLSLKFVMPS